MLQVTAAMAKDIIASICGGIPMLFAITCKTSIAALGP
jgi:hypothetical protein